MKCMISLCLCLMALTLTAQERESYEGKLDLGLNLTSVISSFSGNGSVLDAENIPILLRINTSKFRLRLGAGVRSRENSFFDFLTNANRTSLEQSFFGLAGFEVDFLKENRFVGYAGTDLLGQFQKDEVIIDFDAGRNTITNNFLGVGLSPFIGLKYNLGKRVYLSTEANFSILYTRDTNTETDINAGSNSITLEGEQFNLQPPLFLYLNLKI